MLAGLDLSRLVIMEPNTKNMAPNKRWGLTRYTYVADRLRRAGMEIGQFRLPTDSHQQRIPISGGHYFLTPTFKVACAILSRARLYVGPEGGLHHAAAALGVPAVVIFGGYISPAVTGYEGHRNYFFGEDLGCGKFDPCDHCRLAMDRISAEVVACDALSLLESRHDPSERLLASGPRDPPATIFRAGARVRWRPNVSAPQAPARHAPYQKFPRRP
jgi:ADP-heptose:LPS heptosyltransferase